MIHTLKFDELKSFQKTPERHVLDQNRKRFKDQRATRKMELCLSQEYVEPDQKAIVAFRVHPSITSSTDRVAEILSSTSSPKSKRDRNNSVQEDVLYQEVAHVKAKWQQRWTDLEQQYAIREVVLMDKNAKLTAKNAKLQKQVAKLQKSVEMAAEDAAEREAALTDYEADMTILWSKNATEHAAFEKQHAEMLHQLTEYIVLYKEKTTRKHCEQEKEQELINAILAEKDDMRRKNEAEHASLVKENEDALEQVLQLKQKVWELEQRRPLENRAQHLIGVGVDGHCEASQVVEKDLSKGEKTVHSQPAAVAPTVTEEMLLTAVQPEPALLMTLLGEKTMPETNSESLETSKQASWSLQHELSSPGRCSRRGSIKSNFLNAASAPHLLIGSIYIPTYKSYRYRLQ